MQAAQGFGRRGLAQAAAAEQAIVAAALSPAAAPASPDLAEDDTLTSFQALARADWAQARAERPKIKFWRRYPAMTALGVMALVFLLITLAPLHMSISALRWIRGGLGVGSLFGFGGKRLFRKKPDA